MPEEKIKWDIDHLKKENEAQNKIIDAHETRMREMESFKDSTVEKLITIFNSIDEIKKDSDWMRKTLTTAIIGVIATVIGSLLVWLITS